MNKQTKYNLVGFIVVTNWYGCKGVQKLNIVTNELGLSEIEKDPLQDYTSYGVKSVDYARFDVYKTEVYEKDDRVITIEYKEPTKTIEAGTYNLTEEEEHLIQAYDYDYETITY